MTDIDNVTPPVDLARIEERYLLFYLAGEVPITVSEFATVCTQPEEDVQSILNKRVQRRLIIDSMGVIRLDDAARTPVVKAGKPNIKSARDSLKKGKSNKEDGDFEQAAAQFRQAATVFEAVRGRFEAVNHVPETLEKLLVAAKQNHDSVTKEAAKDTVQYQLIKANQLESAGDESTPGQPKQALEKYEECLDVLSGASDRIAQYNESRLWSESPRLSTDEIQSRIDTVETKKQDVGSKAGGSQASTQVEPNEGGKLDDSSSIDELVGDVDGLNRMAAIKLKNAGYETVDDLQEVSEVELTEIRKVGSTAAQNLLKFLESDSESMATEPDSAAEDSRETGITQHQFLSSIHETAEQLGYVPSEREFNARTGLNTELLTEQIGDWDKIKEEYSDWARKSGLIPVNEKSSNNNSSRTLSSQSTADAVEKLHPSAFETSWETIPDNERLPEQLLIQVEDVNQPGGDKKTHMLKITDRTGKQFTFDIWKTHDIDVDWKKNEWYAVRDTRGNVWETNSGQTRKRLSSTSDLRVVELGVDFDPDQAGVAEQVTASEPTPNSQRTEGRVTPGRPTETTTDSTQDDDGILGEITSEFDDL